MSELKRKIRDVRDPWVNSPYYIHAEEWTFIFWDPHHPFRNLFDQLPKDKGIELACGFGRHAEKAAPLVGHLTLVDVIKENLAVCRERLKGVKNVSFKLGEGASFPATGKNAVSMIYCYDAMVHFDPAVVEAYLKDTARVLRKGGRALYHHSNYAEGKGRDWAQNPHARNYMTRDLFAELAHANGLKVLEQTVIDWSEAKNLDCISLIEKP